MKIDFDTCVGALLINDDPTAPAVWRAAAKKVLRAAPLRPWMIRLLMELGDRA